MRKLLFILTFTVLLSGVTMAADKPVILRLNNGENITLSFSDRPKIVHNGSTIQIISKKGTVQISAESLKLVVFDSTNGIDSPSSTDKKYLFEDGLIKITGETPESTVYLYNESGVLQNTFKTDKDGSVQIPADGNNETIIVKSDSFNFKYMAK